MYRVCFSRYHDAGIIIPVPQVHKTYGKKCVYNLFTKFEDAKEYLHYRLDRSEESARNRYIRGDLKPTNKVFAYELRAGDGRVVERKLRKKQNEDDA